MTKDRTLSLYDLLGRQVSGLVDATAEMAAEEPSEVLAETARLYRAVAASCTEKADMADGFQALHDEQIAKAELPGKRKQQRRGK
jgi:hypothetical protein